MRKLGKTEKYFTIVAPHLGGQKGPTGLHMHLMHTGAIIPDGPVAYVGVGFDEGLAVQFRANGDDPPQHVGQTSESGVRWPTTEIKQF